ncbi:MAG TPA: hypothetical protein VNF29_11295 [Candidatus Binataceae bacterium]|nr:hypothetical protein [Candidatus Binataceae bacterium]
MPVAPDTRAALFGDSADLPARYRRECAIRELRREFIARAMISG